LKVKIKKKSRIIHIWGPRGKLTRDFRHVLIDIKIDEGQKKVILKVWFANKKRLSGLSTVSSHISNSIFGVSNGFQYKMRSVFAHFPINIIMTEGGKGVEIRNFLGEKFVRKVFMAKDVLCKKNDSVKDEIIIYGNDLNLVALSAAQIQKSCLVKKKGYQEIFRWNLRFIKRKDRMI